VEGEKAENSLEPEDVEGTDREQNVATVPLMKVKKATFSDHDSTKSRLQFYAFGQGKKLGSGTALHCTASSLLL
jgi:hypothetical protein